MKYIGRFLGILPLRSISARLALPALMLLLAAAAFAEAPRPDTTQDAKQLIRQSKKLVRGGQLEMAEAALRRALDIEPARTEAKVELAYVLTKQRRVRDAYEMLLPIVQADEKNTRALAVLGMTMLTAGRFREARILFFKAITLNKREDLAWAGYGMVDFYENHIDDSIANLKEAVYHEPDEPDYVFALAQVSARAELYDQAADAYRDFLSISKATDAERRARINGLINFLRYLGHTGQLYNTGGAEQTVVPFDLEGNRPIITLRLNGRPEPLRFVLDTGSGISVISEKTAKRIKIKAVTRGGYAKGLGGDGKFEIVYGLVKQVSLGDVTLRNVPVYLRKFHTEGREIDGYIGLGLISKFLTTIDYGAKTFSLTRRQDDKRAFRDNAELSLPLRLTSSGFLSGEVQLPGIEAPLNFIVDTGASVSVISEGVAKSEGISGFVNDDKMRVIGSAGVTDDVRSFRLPSVTFGNHTRKDVTAVAMDLGILNEASGFEQSGILGGNFLKNYRLTFDFKNSRVTFVSVGPERE